MGTIHVYGSTVVSGYLVTYQSSESNPALILYDYMTLEEAAELVFSAIMGTCAKFINPLAKSKKKIKEKVNAILIQILIILTKSAATQQKRKNAIKDFIKKAGPTILCIIAIIIFLCTGLLVMA